MDLKTMSINDLLKIDTSKLTIDQVAYVEKRLIKIANTRRSRLIKSKMKKISPSLNKAKQPFKPVNEKNVKSVTVTVSTPSGKKKKVKRKSNVRNKRIENVNKVKKFLEDTTSTLTGTKKIIKNLQDLIQRVSGSEKKPLTEKQIKRFFRLWDKAKELYGGEIITDLGKRGGSPVWKKLVELIKNPEYIKNDDILDQLKQTIEGKYEEEQELINDLENEDSNGYDEEDEDAFS